MDEVQRAIAVRRGDSDRRTGIGRMKAREDLHERRLARSVVAEQRDDLSGIDGQGDVVECPHAGEGLAEMTDL
jgi:hypothetical protein